MKKIMKCIDENDPRLIIVKDHARTLFYGTARELLTDKGWAVRKMTRRSVKGLIPDGSGKIEVEVW